MKKNKFALDKLNNGFIDLVKTRYAEKFADDAVQLLEDFKKIEKAYKIYSLWIEKLEKGDIDILRDFRNKRFNLKNIKGYELDNNDDIGDDDVE